MKTVLAMIQQKKLIDCLDVLSNYAFSSDEIKYIKKALKHVGHLEAIADNILFYHSLSQWKAILCDDEVKDINDVEKRILGRIKRQCEYMSRQLEATK